MPDYGNGKFEYLTDENERNMYANAHDAITSCELWEWFGRFNPGEGGFMFGDSPPNLNRIKDKIGSSPIGQNHSGSSFGHTMRVMQYIAKSGYGSYKQLRISKGNA
jgi:hypothetical protein